MYNQIAYLWVTAALPANEAKLVVKLISDGYTVDVAASDGNVAHQHPGTTSAVVALKISKYQWTPIDCFNLLNEIRAFLDSIGTKYFSVILSEAGVCSWNGSNIFGNEPKVDAKSISKNVVN